MKRRNLIKTALASAATLALPPQVFGNQQVTPDAAAGVIGGFNPLSGIPSRFAFGSQFNFGEVTLYQHLPKSGIGDFFLSLRQAVCDSGVYTIGLRANISKNHCFQTIKGLAEERKEKVLILSQGIEFYEEIVKLKEIMESLPNVAVVCSTTSQDHKMELFADNVINFSTHKDGLTSHKCELIKNCRRISGPRVKYFSQATDGQFHNVGVTEQI